jgi:hypothetical protein
VQHRHAGEFLADAGELEQGTRWRGTHVRSLL